MSRISPEPVPALDAHHHLWRYDPAEYPWIEEGMEILKRDYLPADLEAEAAANGVAGAVAVQARQSLAETDVLLEMAAGSELIKGVVGWVPLTAPDLGAELDRLAPNRALVGVRHVVQDEPDDGFILRDDFNAGVARLRDYGLVYDILIYERHLPQATAFVDRHPGQVFVLDHIAKPRVRDGLDRLPAWAARLRDLARRPNVFCKLSGVATEAVWAGWDEGGLRPYLDAAIDAFGPGRLMFGSDWPVCLLATPYRRWVDLVREVAAELTPTEQARLFAGTAAEAYGLGPGVGFSRRRS